MKTIWSEQAWKSIEPIYEEITKLPFIGGLIDGTLKQEQFLFYLHQDALYLYEYGKIMSGIASRLSKPEHITAFTGFAVETVAVERILHESYLKQSPIKGRVEQSPSCLLYTSLLHKYLAQHPVEVALAAVLPRFWIYQEVGNYILANQNKGDNPYQAWIDTYGGEAFAKSVETAIAICNEVAETCTEEQRNVMTEAFVYCSKMEWMFWDSAWRLEEWKI
jgi:Putative transcription activator